MNTAEKLVAIAEKSQEELNTVRGMNEELEGVLNGTGVGGVNQYDAGLLAFFNMLTANGLRPLTQYSASYGTFAYSDFTGYSFPTLMKFKDISRLFYNYKGTALPGNIDFTETGEGTGGYSGYYQTFIYASQLKEIVFNAPAPTKGYIQVFDYCGQLRKLVGLNCVEATTFNRSFYQCYNLTDITIGGVIGQTVTFGDCPLNKASIENVVNVLSDTASGKTLTLRLTAVKKAFETSEGANDGNTSEEWLALAASKSNWTITLA